MKTGTSGWIQAAAFVVTIGALTAQAEEPFKRWTARMDMGGTIPEAAELTEFGGPTGDRRLNLDPGFQFDLAGGYRFTPWLEVGPELGFTYNFVDSVGDWSYPDTTLGQILMMANVRLEYPVQRRLAPFVGAGVGGVASFLTFGNRSGNYYYYAEPDGTGNDFVLACQAFAGARYRVADNVNLGLIYRYLVTDRQRWDVDWWNGSDFTVGIDSLRMHSICLVISGEF